MGLLDALRRPKGCAGCGRYPGACICRNVQKGHDKATRRRGIDPRPHSCPNPGPGGRPCGRTVRNGICPGPNC